MFDGSKKDAIWSERKRASEIERESERDRERMGAVPVVCALDDAATAKFGYCQ